MTTEDTSSIRDEQIASLTGEFADPALELRYRRIHWGEQSQQVRIVCLISVLAYLLAFYQNYIDLGESDYLWNIAYLRLAQFILFGWIITRTFAAEFSPRWQYIVFAAEIVTGLAEAVETVQYQQAGLLTDLTAVPFFAFIILIFYMFLPIRWALTTAATLIGSGFLVVGYAVIVEWQQLEHIIRHPVVLLGVIAIGAGVVRVMNRVRRSDWLHGKKLKLEIDQRRRAEAQALEASRAKSEFLAVMSHEIRTPLNSILAMTEVLSSDSAIQNERSQRQLGVLATAGKHLNDLVDDLLDFSRLEARAETIRTEPFALRTTIHDATAAIENLAKQKGLPLNTHIEETVPEWVLGNEKRVRQILINLIGNAIKFTDAGWIGVRVELADKASGAVRFAISDTGIGIPPGELERIFEPFQQVDASSTRQYQGTGLGLAISRNLVEQMGGNIAAHNRPEGGTVFEFVVPMPLADATASSSSDLSASQPLTAPATPFKALVVEDSELNRIVIEEYLAGVECKLQFADDGRQGVKAFQADSFDIVLMDLQMPAMDGITATQIMRDIERERGLKPTPIVIITADNQNASHQRAERAGVSDYLTKPMSRAELFKALNRHIQAEFATQEQPAAANFTLAPLLPRYFAQTEEDLQAMAQALQEEELEKLATLAHAVKGHSYMFGFPRVGQAAAALEETAKSGTANSAALHVAWKVLETAFTAVVQQGQLSA